MVREDLVGGLRSAMEHGESLQQAMQAFYNTGYNKQDIQEAARYLSSQGLPTPILRQNLKNNPKKLPNMGSETQAMQEQNYQQPTQYLQTNKQMPPQNQNSQQYSSQEIQQAQQVTQAEPSSNMFLIISLIVLLLVLVGGLIWVFMAFKP